MTALLLALLAASAATGTPDATGTPAATSPAGTASPASPSATSAAARSSAAASDGATPPSGPGDCGLQPCTPEVPVPRPPPGKGLRAAAVPVIAYASDTGVRLAGGLFLYGLNENDVRSSWAAIQLSWTSRGPRYAEVKGELLHVAGTQLRSFYQLKVNDDVAAPYWGEGAHLDAGPPPGAGGPPAPYQYHVAGPWLAATVRGPLHGPWAWFTRARWTRRNISNRGAVLQEERPLGYDGGGTGLLGGGVIYDTRDDEVGVRRGLFADASLFAAPHVPLWGISKQSFGGVNVTVREYVPLWRGATFAMRQLYENKVGDVPFTERTLLEGLGYGEGIGGAGTIRGLARDRLAGEEKMLASAELRAMFAETRWFGRPQQFGASVGADAGRARQRGYAPVTAAGAFAGLRMVWDRAVLVRFEVGDAGQGGVAYYLSFDEPF